MRWLTSRAEADTRGYWVAAALGVWLAGWIVLSWAAIQDDALIHLRYADNLYLHHFITYDGVHANYGASSLLYVSILSLLRGVSASPQLPRAVSSVVHLLLFGGIAAGFGLRLAKAGRVARLAGFALLVLVVAPSAVRWLDDGMETGLVASVVTVLAWLIHGRVARGGARQGDLLLGAVSFLAVMLRTELLLLCVVGFLILIFERVRGERADGLQRREETWYPVGILIGAVLAVGAILATMHVLLPDTALAKSHGTAHWFNPVHDTAVTLGGAFSFGIGMLLFWLLTLALVAMRRGGTAVSLLLANCFCPVVLGLSSLRGQEIQGVRYFAWTFFFSILWNVLELARLDEHNAPIERRSAVLLYVFLGLLLVELPFESVAMHRVLTRRSETMRVFEGQRLDVLAARHGVASDVGYIGYFSKAEICDMAGLVNGREAAKLSGPERVVACAATKPDFMFGNSSQVGTMAAVMDFSGWKMCGRYNFTNVRTLDTHYLLVRPAIADEVCRATGSEVVEVEEVPGLGR